MKRVLLQEAYVLHRRPYRETSFLIELFSKEHGRLAVIAKGARNPRSPLQGLLQAFVPLLASFTGKGELMLLAHAEINGTAKHLFGEGLFAGLYLNELLVCLLQPWDAHSGLYMAYEKALTALQRDALPNDVSEDGLQQRALRSFEKCLLEELGYGILPKSEISLHNRFASGTYYRFIHNQGFVACERFADQTSGSGGDIFSGKSLIAIAMENWEEEGSLTDAKRLVRLLLAPLLGDRPLHSRKLYL